MRKEEELAQELNSRFQEETRPGTAETDAKLRAAGFDTDALAVRFQRVASDALGAEKRKRARAAFDRISSLLSEIRGGLQGPKLQVAIREFRESLPTGLAIQNLPAYRNLVMESQPYYETASPDEAQIVQDLMALAKLIESNELGEDERQS